MRTHNNNLTRFFIASIVIIPTIFLAACGGGGGGSSSNPPITPTQTDVSNITDSQAQAAAKSAISSNINNMINALDAIGTSSSAVDTAATTVGLSLQPTPLVATALDDSSTTAALEQQIQDALDLLFNNGVRDGSTITYDPDEQAMCSDAVFGKLPDLASSIGTSGIDTAGLIQECVDLYSHVTVVLTILGEEEGTLAINYDSFNLITIGYNTSETYVDIDLAQLKSIIEAIGASQDPPEDAGLPSVFEGVIRLTSAVLGTNHGKLTLSIEQAINIAEEATDSNPNETSVLLEAAPKVLELIANANDKTASVEVALAAIKVLFPFEVNANVEQQADLSIAGLTLKADLINDGDQIVFSNVGIGDAPLVLNIVDLSGFILDGVDDIKLTLDTFGFTVDGVQNTIWFPSMFSSSLEIHDDSGVINGLPLDGTIGVMVLDGTVLVPTESGILNVTSGSVSQTGGGDFDLGSTFIPGSCFTFNENVLDITGENSLPLLGVECP